MFTLWILIGIALVSGFIILKSASYALEAIIEYAKKTGISGFLVGFLIVAVGTSLPELSTAIFASLAGKGILSLGNVIGSNIIDMTVVLGLTFLVAKRLKEREKIDWKNVMIVLGIVLLLLLLGIDGVLSRIDGIALLSCFCAYVLSLLFRERKAGKMKKQIKLSKIIAPALTFVFAIAALLLGAQWLVHSSVEISRIAGIPVFIVGLFFVSIGTVSPEIIVNIKSALKGVAALGIGNVLGTVISNIALVLGIAASISPMRLELPDFVSGVGFILFLVSIITLFAWKKTLNWKHGIFLLACYAVFVIVTFIL